MREPSGHKPSRTLVEWLSTAALLLVLISPALAQHRGPAGHFGGAHPGFPHAMPRQGRFGQPPGRFGPRPGQEHLPEWFRQHQNMSLPQQEQALRREPGFNRLSPAQRQRIMHRLRKLDSIPPAQRQRILARNEAFERLSPERRQEVRAAAQAFSQMPPMQRQQLRRAFRVLRTLPPNQRTEILNSARFRATYSPRERNILGHLLSIEPYQPPPPGAHPPRQPW
jgi:hypothetical protein